MVVGFVNAGIMKLSQAVGVIMGANIGTTATSWLLSLTGLEGDEIWVKLFKPSSFSPLLSLIGVILLMLKSQSGSKQKTLGTIFIGFAILMTGMETMSGSVSSLSHSPRFTGFFQPCNGGLIWVVIDDDNSEFLCFDRYFTSSLHHWKHNLWSGNSNHSRTKYRHMCNCNSIVNWNL